MLKLSVLTYALAAGFTDYPVFIAPDNVVEAVTARGPLLELIVRCPDGTGILSYSKIEALFCSSKHVCFADWRAAVADTCR
jgi:hypothetical protein